MNRIVVLCLTFLIHQIAVSQHYKEAEIDESKIVTLTDGKYPEVFHNDTIRKIGRALYNTQTGTVERILTEEEAKNWYGQETSAIRPNAVSASRWLSVDPLAVKYMDVSPYAFVANSPILFIDPNGKEIEVTDPETGQVHIFKPGDAVPTGASTFVHDVYVALTYLNDLESKKETGPNRVTALVNSSRVLSITQSLEHGGNTFRPDANLVSDKSLTFNNKLLDIYSNGGSQSPVAGLAHELDHAYMFFLLADTWLNSKTDDNFGKINDTFFNGGDGSGTKGEEQRAMMGFETEVATDLNQHVRTGDYFSVEAIPTSFAISGNVLGGDLTGPITEADQEMIDKGNQASLNNFILQSGNGEK